MRRIFQNEEAKEIWNQIAELEYKNLPKHLHNIGGIFLEGIVILAFDTTNGNEAFIEEFSNYTEARKYASGEMATTREGVEI